jgi:hypothetical protein
MTTIKKPTTNAGEDERKNEPLYTVRGNYSSHYGNQYRHSSKK